MSRKSASLALMYAGLGMIGSSMFDINRKDKVVPREVVSKKVLPPLGTEYFFNEDGEFCDTKEESVFSCFALNQRNALRKFYNWNNGKNSLRG